MQDIMQFASAITRLSDVDSAARELAEQVREQLGPERVELAVVFMSGHFARAAGFVADQLCGNLNARVLLGCTAEGVVSREHELERVPAMTLLAGHLPEVELAPFVLAPGEWEAGLDDAALFRQLVAAPADCRAIVLLADPFTLRIDELLAAFNRFYPGIPVIGGMASGALRAGGNALVLNERVHTAGAIGVALAGPVELDLVVSQGCRPIGPPLHVTSSEKNAILELDGTSALERGWDLLNQLPEEDRALLDNGLYLGRAVEQGRELYGRGDFVIRSVLGGDPASGALLVGDDRAFQDNEIVQFHLRDQNTAAEDLEMLLLPEALTEPPSGALLFTCNGRGTRLYDHPDGDIGTIQKALDGIQLAGFFCAGEIGPIGGKSFLHGHTASLLFFRPGK